MSDIEQPTKHLPPLQTYRILCLEDPENMDRLTAACKQAGHQVVPMTTITHAMNFLETKDHVDVIVAATHLQSESVFEFLKRVRDAESHLKDVPFLMLCANHSMLAVLTSPGVELAAAIKGANKYVLMTEFDAQLLMAEIEPLLPPIPLKELHTA
jgi:CheY-like chemotaxis protein